MKSNAIAYGILRAIGILAGIFMLLWFLYEIQSVLVYLAVAAVISLIGRPITIFLKRRFKMGDTWAAITTIVLVFLAISGILALFIPVVIDQSTHLSNIDFNEVKVSISRLYGEIAQYFGVSKTTIIKGVQESNFIQEIDFGIIPSFLNGIIGNLGAALIGIFSVIFITFFFLKDSRLLVSGILVFANRGNEGKFL